MDTTQADNKKDFANSPELPKDEEILSDTLRPILFFLGIMFFAASAYFFADSYSFMKNDGDYYAAGMHKEYVGADAFNYIIAGTYSTTIMLRAVFFVVLGVGCFLAGKKQTVVFKDFDNGQNLIAEKPIKIEEKQKQLRRADNENEKKIEKIPLKKQKN